MTLARFKYFLATGAVLSGLLTAAVCSVRIGVADYRMRQGTVQSTEAAIALIPDHAEYRARLAWLVSDRDPAKATHALHRAVLLNPWDARSWIGLGLRAEASGDAAAARQYLLRAAQADNKFLPRWTLANYYFRHDDAAAFWFWAKAAAEMVYGDAQPLFRLCGRVREDGQLIERLNIQDPAVRAAYLAYLLGENRVDLTGFAIHRLLRDGRKTDVPLLLSACERLLDAREVALAAEIWNGLASAGSVPFPTASAEGQQLIANDSFLSPPSSVGFDWRLPTLAGISVSQEESRELRITFSGREPENCEPLLQLVPTRAGSLYRLKFEYRTSGLRIGDGLAWRAADATSGKLLAEGALAPAETEAEGALEFVTPVECRLVRLALGYRRTSGTTRLDGFLILRKVSLQPKR